MQAGIGGETVSTLIEGTRRFDIAVRLADEFRNIGHRSNADPHREGELVPFSQVARIELDEGYTFVRREALQRYAVMQMDVQGRDVDGFVQDANAAMRPRSSCRRLLGRMGGAFENQQRAMARLAPILFT